MSHSQRLRLKDVRAAYRLIGECREMSTTSAPDQAWWRHMLTKLCPLVGAQVGIAGVFRNFGTPEQQILAVADLGWTGRVERAHFLRYQAHGGEQRDLVFRRFARLTGGLITRSREQLLGDTEWYTSPIYQEYLKLAGIDGKIMSLSALPGEDSLSHLLTLKRPPGQRAFDRREMRLVHLFHHEFSASLGGKLIAPSPIAVETLPPRLRQVLVCLMEGDSEQQVACRLGISAHTVHEHVKRLHRRFNVSSRGELLRAGSRPISDAAEEATGLTSKTKHAPESDVLGLPYSQINKVLHAKGYDRAKQAWLQVVQESHANLSVLQNASTFCLLHDRKISEGLQLKGQQG